VGDRNEATKGKIFYTVNLIESINIKIPSLPELAHHFINNALVPGNIFPCRFMRNGSVVGGILTLNLI
jgi:hypothetical protein